MGSVFSLLTCKGFQGRRVQLSWTLNPVPMRISVYRTTHGSQALVRIMRGSRVYTPRVGPRSVPKVSPLNDALAIEFDMDNPKRAGSTSWELGFTQTKLVEDAFQRERHHESHHTVNKKLSDPEKWATCMRGR